MDKCKNHKTFPSELVEYSYLLISLLSTNSKNVILWPWPHICSLLHLFTIESWSVTVHNLPFYFFFCSGLLVCFPLKLVKAVSQKKCWYYTTITQKVDTALILRMIESKTVFSQIQIQCSEMIWITGADRVCRLELELMTFWSAPEPPLIC